MLIHETPHYLFHYGEHTPAARDIEGIAACQEGCYRHICQVLGIAPSLRITYCLCSTPEEVGRIYGDNEPCNGFAAPPDRIYAVYNEQVRCIGFHEDAHLLSYTIARPDCPALREGLAMFFDRKWWGIHNLDWTGWYLDTGRCLPLDDLLDRETFFATDCAITYPVMGALTDWLISTYGMERYLHLYRSNSLPARALREVYHQSPEDMDQAFRAYVRLFRTDEELKQRMAALLASCGGA